MMISRRKGGKRKQYQCTVGGCGSSVEATSGDIMAGVWHLGRAGMFLAGVQHL